MWGSHLFVEIGLGELVVVVVVVVVVVLGQISCRIPSVRYLMASWNWGAQSGVTKVLVHFSNWVQEKNCCMGLGVLESICYRARANRLINENVCMYRGCPSWSALGIGRPTGPGGRTHQKWVQCSNPTGIIGPVLRMLADTCTLRVLFVANFTLGS